MKYFLIFFLLFCNLESKNKKATINTEYNIEIYIGFSLVGISEKKCSFEFLDFMENNYGNIQIIADDFLIHNQIYYIKDSLNLISSKNDSIAKNQCKDIFLLTQKNNKFDTIGIKINSPFISINSLNYLDENKSILNNLISLLPCGIVSRIGKRCD